MRQIPYAVLAVACAACLAAVAQTSVAAEPKYKVDNLSPLGGTSSVGNSINDFGWIAGRSNLSTGIRHAALWRKGAVTDLGSLGGPDRNSAVLWPVKNLRGIITGITQTAEPDPLNEQWSCGFFFSVNATGNRCVGFRWHNGVMTPLPTLGGTHGFATGTNNFGLTVGWAENTVRDPTCDSVTKPGVGRQVLQFRAVVWGPQGNIVRELPPLPGTGDTVTAATAINDRGQVVGISGVCDQAVGRLSAIHAVLWEQGKPIDIGDFGGIAWNTPMSINQRGDIVGFANSSEADGETLNPRAFVKFKGQPIQNLGTLKDDVDSQALGINEWRQVVGVSCGVDVCRAFLWHNGVMTDLNTLASGNDGLLISANDIDNFGRITGQAFNATGQRVAFLATPVW